MSTSLNFPIIENDLIVFEKKFKASVKSNAPLLDRITHYLVNRKGKQMRPRFVLLSARLFGDCTESTFVAASLVELLHTATLVHDDVVDESDERRGFFSINALWKNKIAVLVGDFLLTKGLLLSLDNGEFKVLQLLTNAIRQMSEGELLQIEKSRKLNLNQEVYFEIIRSKTASLLASACAAGAWSTTHDLEKTELLRVFGEKVGMAFQIKDDLFDYSDADVGKPTGNDIREKKLTLPLIYSLQVANQADRRKMMYILKNEHHNKVSVSWVIKKVNEYGGIAYAAQKMESFKQEALDILNKFEQNAASRALKELVEYSTNRKY